MMFYGFNNKKRSTISSGDWDKDGVPNRKDCEPLNWKKQDKKCIGCGRDIPYLEEFPGPRCLDCHEKKFDEELKKTGNMQKPDFVGALNV